VNTRGRPSALRPVPRRRLYEQVAERVLSHIVQTGLHEGDRLPTERELATRLAVSRASVRQAIAVLEAQGILEVRHGNGTFMRQVDRSSEPFARLLLRRRRLPEVLEAREALELKIAELAAKRRTAADVEAIEAALARMEGEVTDGDIGVDGDKAFHHAVALASHNTLLCELMEYSAEDIEETRVESLSQPGRPPQSLVDHRRIADAIRVGDVREAVEAMRAHIFLVGDVALLDGKPDEPNRKRARK
jgi:GntR family transcriptional repressor for pyruvate dehydrogenase complex